MDPAALAGLCLLLARGQSAQPLPAGVNCPPPAPASAVMAPPLTRSGLAPLVAGPDAREAITRVAFAEAGNQGDSGLAAVVYTILNRVQDGRWGATVEAVVNARGQFEPVMRVEVVVPEEYMGDIMGDMNKRRGRIMGVNPIEGGQQVVAEVPMSEMAKYANDLRSMTQGRGWYTIAFARYDTAPQLIADKVIAEAKVHMTHEEEEE